MHHLGYLLHYCYCYHHLLHLNLQQGFVVLPQVHRTSPQCVQDFLHHHCHVDQA